jgi:hypothetical protein
MPDPPDAPVPYIPVETSLHDGLPGARGEPRGILDNPAVHVGHIKAAIRPSSGINKAAIDIRRPKELTISRFGLLEEFQAILPGDG